MHKVDGALLVVVKVLVLVEELGDRRRGQGVVRLGGVVDAHRQLGGLAQIAEVLNQRGLGEAVHLSLIHI